MSNSRFNLCRSIVLSGTAYRYWFCRRYAVLAVLYITLMERCAACAVDFINFHQDPLWELVGILIPCI